MPGAELDPPFELGRFHVVERLGRGGMGVVYRAEDSRLKRMVAIKVLPRELEKDDKRRQRLLREARSAAAVTHPNVATIHEVNEEDGRAFIVMELVEGTSLRRCLEAGRLSVADVSRFARGIARALARAHEKGVVHRDLKPDNVMIDRDREVKVLDFGLAKLRDEAMAAQGAEDEATETALTLEGAVLGTPGYMSPEQLLGRPVDARTDIFSFGVVLYEMATGVRPFRGDSTMDVSAQIQRDEPERPSKVEPGIDRRLEKIIERCLAKKPADRFAHGGELLDALEAAPATNTARRQVPYVGVGIVAAVLLAGGLGARWWLQAKPPAPSPAPSSSAAASASAPPWWDDSPETSSNPEAQKALRDGMRSLHDGTGRGNINFRRAIELDPEFATPRVRLLASIGCMGELRESYTKLVALRAKLGERDRAYVDAFPPLCQQDPPDTPEHERRLRVLAERYPDDPMALFTISAGSLADQVARLDHLLAIDPACAGAYAWRAGAQAAMGDVEGAVRSYDACLKLSPGALNCQTSLVELLAEGDDCGRLEKEARRATLMGTEYQAPYIALASALAAEGRPSEALVEVFKQARTKRPNPTGSLPVSEVNARCFAGDFVSAARAAEELERKVESSSREEEHALPAVVRVEIDEETGDLRAAAAEASSFMARRGGWEASGDEGGSVAVMIAVMRAAGTMSATQAARERERELPRVSGGADSQFGPWIVWLDLWATGVRTPADAREALAALPDGTAPGFFRGTDLEPVGRTLLLGGRLEDAITWLEKSAHACNVLKDPFFSTRAHLWLGEAREQKGDKAAACAEYAVVLDRWGHAKPRSVTADEARAHRRTLGCDSR
jgi:serine/threonine protein kinase/tetratricopeptide (TPR) repeat protein